jgi:hypothetical protein
MSESTAVEKSRRERVIRLPIGLLLSIGEEKPEGGPGRSIDYFRPKPGELGQYASAALKFGEVYGEKPDAIDDLYFLANAVPDVLDIRILAFSKLGIRGIGQTNFANITDADEFEERVWGSESFKDDFLFFPKDQKEVRAELRENWEGEPIQGTLTGRDDPRVKRLDAKVVASLEFCLPQVMGVGTVARISTSGRTSTRNLWKALWQEWITFGSLTGIPFRLSNRPRKKTYFNPEKKAMMPTTIRELVLDTPQTVKEIYDSIAQHREALGPAAADRDRMALEGQALMRRLALPPAPDDEKRTREEVDATPSDALLNRIAIVEQEVGIEAAHTVLRGVFGVESATELDPEKAERYWSILEASIDTEHVPAEDVVVFDDEGSGAGPDDGNAPDVVDESADAAAEAVAEDESSAPDDSLPGEPGDEDLMAAVDVACDLVIPKGTHKGKRLCDMLDHKTWIRYCLQNASVWADQPTFYAGLELVAREKMPELWAEVRG